MVLILLVFLFNAIHIRIRHTIRLCIYDTGYSDLVLLPALMPDIECFCERLALIALAEEESNAIYLLKVV